MKTVKTRAKTVKTRAKTANTRTKTVKIRTKTANTRTKTANTRTKTTNTRTKTANTRTKIVETKTISGKTIAFEAIHFASGGMKDVHYTTDKANVVAFFRDPVDRRGMERLKSIVGPYREGIFQNDGGEYWSELFRWPTDIVEHGGRVGVVVPAYEPHFYFKTGSIDNDTLNIKGKEKQGKWFSTCRNHNKLLHPEERGDWLSRIRSMIRVSRAVRRMHAAGLAHSDLSHKNVLIDPVSAKACVIDIDGLVVKGKHLPDVIGTHEFIAPEAVATSHLDRNDPKRVLPCPVTDQHALSVMIYMHMLLRHPLRGGKKHHDDPATDESLAMGKRALFIEHPRAHSNRVKPKQLRPEERKWGDPDKIPYTISGPYLTPLFKRAFVDGIADPRARPTPGEWELALMRTLDMIVPCAPGCDMGWHVHDGSNRPRCPSCGHGHSNQVPLLEVHSKRGSRHTPNGTRIAVWNKKSLFRWHADSEFVPNERLPVDMWGRVGYMQFHAGQWFIKNLGMEGMRNVSEDCEIPVGEHVFLKPGQILLLSPGERGHLVHVKMTNQ